MTRSGNSEHIDSDQSSYSFAFSLFPLIKPLPPPSTSFYLYSLRLEFLIGIPDISEIRVLLLILLMMLDYVFFISLSKSC